MDKLNYLTKDYLADLTKKVITIEEWRAFAKNYSLNNKNDSANKLIARFIDKIESRHITNDDLSTFDYLTNIFIKNTNDKQIINNFDKLTLKKTLQNIYKHCQKMGVVREIGEKSVKYSYDMKHMSGYSTIKNMYLFLLQTPKTINKPPKKEKAKKTTKK